MSLPIPDPRNGVDAAKHMGLERPFERFCRKIFPAFYQRACRRQKLRQTSLGLVPLQRAILWTFQNHFPQLYQSWPHCSHRSLHYAPRRRGHVHPRTKRLDCLSLACSNASTHTGCIRPSGITGQNLQFATRRV